MEMHLGVAATQFRNVRLESFLIEPAVHLIVLFAQNALNHRHGKLLKLDWLAKDTTEDFGSLGIGQFASCNLQYLSDELCAAIKPHAYKAPDLPDNHSP